MQTDLFTSLGSPRYICAPMVDASELAFRMLTREHGVGLCYSPMYNAKTFISSPKCFKQFTTCAEDRPLFVQFCANDPKTLLSAARLVEGKCDAVDLNFGCPQGIAKRGHYGAYLLKEVDLMCDLISILAENLSIPVTCKIRVFDNIDETVVMAKRLEKAGISMLGVHGRTIDMKKEKVSACNFEAIKRIKNALRIPVIANGGVEHVGDADRVLEITGADGIMAAEGLLEHPDLFAGGNLRDVEIARQYCEFARKFPPQRSSMKLHLFKILHRSLSIHKDVRTKLGQARCVEDMLRIPEELHEAIEKMGRDEFDEKRSHSRSWYNRYRKDL